MRTVSNFSYNKPDSNQNKQKVNDNQLVPPLTGVSEAAGQGVVKVYNNGLALVKHESIGT